MDRKFKKMDKQFENSSRMTKKKPRETTENPAYHQPFKFPGQYEDEETGLYYNRFRYYMPEEGIYTQRDPIGLAGGNPTVYGYVWNTLTQLDPWGLSEHRGRIQAQGVNLEKSVPWTQNNPPTVAEGLQMLDDLENQLSRAERKLRAPQIEKARSFIKNTGRAGGIDMLLLVKLFKFLAQDMKE